MAKYTMKDFIDGKIVVHVGTNYQKFLELCGKHGLKWTNGNAAIHYQPSRYEKDTVIINAPSPYHLNKSLMFGPIQVYSHVCPDRIVKPEDIAEMTPKYTMKDFIKKPIAVRVGQEHAEEFLQMCEAEGLRWMSGLKATEHTPSGYGDSLSICYNFPKCPKGLGQSPDRFYMENGWMVIDFTDIEPNMHRYQIIIDCEDDKVTKARMMVGGREVKTTIARRNPVDEFDFAIGAKVAFDRLFGKEPSAPVESVPAPKFKVGDRVKCIRSVGTNNKIVNKYGTVRDVHSDGWCAVEFDVNINGHECGGTIKSGRGWYCPADKLEPAPVREVKRHAKVGEYVKIVESTFYKNRFKVGEIHKVTGQLMDAGEVVLDCGSPYASPNEYVVLEGYKPE